MAQSKRLKDEWRLMGVPNGTLATMGERLAELQQQTADRRMANMQMNLRDLEQELFETLSREIQIELEQEQQRRDKLVECVLKGWHAVHAKGNDRELQQWCQENCHGEYHGLDGIVAFEREDDATMCKLVWL